MNEYNDKFLCDECQTIFSILDGGFIGSLSDYEVSKLSTDDKHLIELLNEIKCLSCLEFVELCQDCYLQKK